MSRYMNRIIEINPEEGWVRVEAGVIKDQLNQYLKPYGYFFAPELSTSNRATLGGMINTDASGQGSLVYGKTSDHVLGVRAVLLGGDILDTQPVPVELAETLGKDNTTAGRIYRTVLESCRDNRQLIIDKFPKLNRFLTGYDLRHVFNDDLSQFDLTRILTGSEGTLAFITEARLDITRLPKVRRLVNVKYNSFDSALRNAPFMVDARALSVETVDSKVLNLAREDIVWHSVSELITDVPDKEMLGLNIVEFAGDDAALIESQVEALCQRLDELIARGEGGVIGWQLCNGWPVSSVSMRCVKKRWACWVTPKAQPSRSLCRGYLRSAGTPCRLHCGISRPARQPRPELRHVRPCRRRGAARSSGAGHVRSAAGDADEADLR